MKKVTAQQIIDNINARLILLKSQGFKDHIASMQLQELLDDICRHNMGIESIETSTKNHEVKK